LAFSYFEEVIFMAQSMITSVVTVGNSIGKSKDVRNLRKYIQEWREVLRLALLVGATLLCFGLSIEFSGPKPVILGVIILGSVVSGIAGFAFAAICGALLFHVSGNALEDVQILMLCSIANQASMVWAIRRSVHLRKVAVFVAGGFVGLPIGIFALLYLDQHVYANVIGLILFVYGIVMLVRQPVILRSQSFALDMLAGFFGGITGGTIGFPSASVTIWCGFKGWDKEQQRAVFQPFILIMQVVALIAISLVRHPTGNAGFDLRDFYCVPGALLGTMLGLMCYRRLSDKHFSRAINILLIFSGLSYLI